MECNIDARGKATRLIWGLLLIVAALAVGALAALGLLHAWWWWIVVTALLLFGALGVYEARKGWCVVRAMGIKTPM